MKTREEREQLRRKKDEAINHLFIWFVGAIVLEIVAMFVKNHFFNYSITESDLALASRLLSVFQVFQWVGLGILIAAAVWGALWKKQGKNLLAPMLVLAIDAGLWIITILAYRGGTVGEALLSVFAPAVGILAVLWYLYPRDFLCHAVLTGCGFTALWMYRKIYLNHPRATYCGFALVFLLLVLGAVLYVVMAKNGGVWKGRRIFHQYANYPLGYITCGLTAAVMALTLALGTTAAFYCLFVLLAWLFCMAVYYTVKLM